MIQNKFKGSPFSDPKVYQKHIKIPYKDYNIPFPYQPYDVQKTFMTTMIEALDSESNALLQSPTGTGKTLCLLSSVLTWYEKRIKDKPLDKFKIIYASRTHSQLRQVIKQLKSTCFRPKIVTASSRDQSCINVQLDGTFGHLKEIECRKRIKGRLATCEFSTIRKAVAKYLNQDMPILDLPEIKQLGLAEQFCPFLFNRSEDYLSEVDLILMPYNYVMDRNVIGIYEKVLPDCVLIIDQAHNIQNVAMDGASMTLRMSMLAAAKQQVQKLKVKAIVSGVCEVDDIEFDFLLRTIIKLQNNLSDQVDIIKNQYGSDGKMFTEKQMLAMFLEVMQSKCQQELLTELERFTTIGSKLMLVMSQEYLWQFDKTTGYLQLLHEIIKEQELRPFYRLCYRQEDQIGVFELWCIDPSVSFKKFQKLGVKNIILTSGTLSPLSSWESELKIPFKFKLSNSHVIENTQVMLNIVSCGPRSEKFLFNYENRNNENLNYDICNAIVELAQYIPNGIVVFFPSNAVLDNTMRSMRNFNLLNHLMKLKHFHFEPKGDMNFQSMFLKYKKDALTSKGAILFAVCRSRVSEGIDLSDQLCRAVIFIGVPFPPVKDMKITEKRAYQDKLKLKSRSIPENQKKFSDPIGGEQWYIQQTTRAVNQSIGRTIRHKNDYGAIYLMDCRYGSNVSLTKALPKWAITNQKKICHNFENLIEDTKAFFEKNKKLDGLIRPSFMSDEPDDNKDKDKPRISLKKQINPQIDAKIKTWINNKKKSSFIESSSSEKKRKRSTLHHYFGKKQSEKKIEPPEKSIKTTTSQTQEDTLKQLKQ